MRAAHRRARALRPSGRLLTTSQRHPPAPAVEIHYLPAPASCAPWVSKTHPMWYSTARELEARRWRRGEKGHTRKAETSMYMHPHSRMAKGGRGTQRVNRPTACRL